MPFVQRTSAGAITGVYARLQPGIAEEFLPDDNPDVIAFRAPKPPADLSDLDNLEKSLKATVMLTRQYANAIKAGTYTAKTIADTKSDFAAIYRALP